jgi:hypothetical protein
MARRRHAVTIKHAAADAGVSLQTVSRVINSEPNVRPAMQERVQVSIDRLGYVPSIAAQRMSGSRSYLILAINDCDRTIVETFSKAVELLINYPDRCRSARPVATKGNLIKRGSTAPSVANASL